VVPLLEPLGFSSEIAKAIIVLVIGAGSLVASHANDSFFWVFTQMTNMSVRNGLRLHTTGTMILGVTAGFALWVISLFVL
jgi:GntP family gluconate:H+ symporter